MQALINKLTTKPGKRDEVIAILLESGQAFDDNPACVLYQVSKDSKNQNVIWVQDQWTDEEAHTAAMNDETMQGFVKQSMPLLEGMPEQIPIEHVGGKIPWQVAGLWAK